MEIGLVCSVCVHDRQSMLKMRTPHYLLRATHYPLVDYTIFISQPSTFSSGLIFHERFFAAP